MTEMFREFYENPFLTIMMSLLQCTNGIYAMLKLDFHYLWVSKRCFSKIYRCLYNVIVNNYNFYTAVCMTVLALE